MFLGKDKKRLEGLEEAVYEIRNKQENLYNYLAEMKGDFMKKFQSIDINANSRINKIDCLLEAIMEYLDVKSDKIQVPDPTYAPPLTEPTIDKIVIRKKSRPKKKGAK